jgi:hypothetical protein
MLLENRRKTAVALACASTFGLAVLTALPAAADDNDNNGNNRDGIKHVLLISVDGMHEVDLQRYVASHPASTFAKLLAHGVHFTNAHTSGPSDSFPGLLAFMTGGSPRSHGIFYDDTYDHTLFAPNSNCTGAPGTETQFAENIDFDLTQLDGGGPPGSNHINPANLPRRLVGGNCVPVFPHQFIKVNTIMEVIHQAGMRTAWSDKHPAYEIVSGPSGQGLDELFSPEINSTSVPGHPGADWTTDPVFTRTYDGFKVTGVLNQIRGFDHTGTTRVGVPAIFGMNFQAVSVGQKVTADGYLDAAATPSPQLAASLDFVDGALGQFVQALRAQHLERSTLIIVGAKHGQSPIDVSKLHMLVGSTNPKLLPGHADVTDPIDILANGGVSVAQETADDVSLIWLADQSQAAAAVALLNSDMRNGNHARIAHIFAGDELKAEFGDPALGRTPDIIIQPIPGTIYSKSAAKISEHGGFAEDDTHVLLVVANPAFQRTVVDATVENKQVAPTILKALGLAPEKLQAVRMEHTRVLPGLDQDDRQD